MVVISTITCIIAIKTLGSVGAGTIIAAILVGVFVGIINKAFGEKRDRLFGKTEDNYVIDYERAN